MDKGDQYFVFRKCANVDLIVHNDLLQLLRKMKFQGRNKNANKVDKVIA